MKKVILSLMFCLCAAFSIAQNKLSFEISGKISPKLSDSIDKVFLYYFEDNKNYADSTLLTKGSFSFKGKVNGVTQATLLPHFKGLSPRENQSRAMKESRIVCLGEGKIQLTINGSFAAAIVQGSAMTAFADTYRNFLKPFVDHNEKVYQETRKEPASEARSAKKRVASQAIVTAKKDFIAKHPSNPFALEAMKDALQDFQNDKLFTAGEDSIYAELIALNKTMDAKLRASAEGKEFDLRLKELASKKLPHFAGPSLAGGRLDINSYKGRVFLIDFWGSWCVWCRKGHPHLKEVYEKFKPYGFEIIGVGVEFDKDRKVGEKKLRDAIAKDEISWPQIFNENDGNNDLRKIFSIYAYPTKILVDQSGKIILRVTDDEAHQLDAKLEELFSKKAKSK